MCMAERKSILFHRRSHCFILHHIHRLTFFFYETPLSSRYLHHIHIALNLVQIRDMLLRDTPAPVPAWNNRTIRALITYASTYPPSPRPAMTFVPPPANPIGVRRRTWHVTTIRRRTRATLPIGASVNGPSRRTSIRPADATPYKMYNAPPLTKRRWSHIRVTAISTKRH